MAIVHPEHLPWRHAGEYSGNSRRSEPGAAPPRSKSAHERPYVSKHERWIPAGLLLAATGWMIFQFLVTLVTLD